MNSLQELFRDKTPQKAKCRPYTALSIAAQIVPDNEIWVMVRAKVWPPIYELGAWNDALTLSNGNMPGILDTKMVVGIPNRLTRGWVYRPLNEYVDFNNNPIVLGIGQYSEK